MSRENSGHNVVTKNGKKGRTWHSKGLINGKLPVYLYTKFEPTGISGMEIGTETAETAILCDPATVKVVGYID